MSASLSCVTLVREQEQLRRAHDLTQQAAALLAELSVGSDLDLKVEIKLATTARKSCEDAVTRLDSQIARTPL